VVVWQPPQSPALANMARAARAWIYRAGKLAKLRRALYTFCRRALAPPLSNRGCKSADSRARKLRRKMIFIAGAAVKFR